MLMWQMCLIYATVMTFLPAKLVNDVICIFLVYVPLLFSLSELVLKYIFLSSWDKYMLVYLFTIVHLFRF